MNVPEGMEGKRAAFNLNSCQSLHGVNRSLAAAERKRLKTGMAAVLLSH